MALTVKHLKEILSAMRDDAIIRDEQNQDFTHIVASDTLLLSTVEPIGTCNRSGQNVYPSEVRGYSAFSPALDEDLFKFEWTPFK
jgi:hypothetical protein